jgi:hypothetical protein
MQLSRSSILEVHLVPHGRAIHLAHRVILLPRSNWAALGAKRTLTSAGRAPDLWAHAQVRRVAAPEYTWLASRRFGLFAYRRYGAPAVRVLVAFPP